MRRGVARGTARGAPASAALQASSIDVSLACKQASSGWFAHSCRPQVARTTGNSQPVPATHLLSVQATSSTAQHRISTLQRRRDCEPRRAYHCALVTTSGS
jgi:hypothetical protein